MTALIAWLKGHPALWPLILVAFIFVNNWRMSRIEGSMNWMVTQQAAIMKKLGIYPTTPLLPFE